MTETSSLVLRVTTQGDSWIMSALSLLVGCPTNSGRSSISIFKAKNPAEMAAQARNPANKVLAAGRHGPGAGRWPVVVSFVIIRLIECDRPVQKFGP
jgi:hypothetical protein